MKLPKKTDNIDGLDLQWDKSEEIFQKQRRLQEILDSSKKTPDLNLYFEFLEHCKPPKDIGPKPLPVDKRFEL